MATLASEEKFGYSNILRMLIPGFTTLVMLVLFFRYSYFSNGPVYIIHYIKLFISCKCI